MSGVTTIQKPWFAKLVLRLHPHDDVRTVVGCLLLIAAGLKIYHRVLDPASLAIQGGLLASKWAVIAVVEAEIFLGLCLLLKLWQRPTWFATLLLFGIFSVYSATKALAGEPCGCFGVAPANVPAEAMLVLDLTVIAGLGVFRPRLTGARRGPNVNGQSRASGSVRGIRNWLKWLPVGFSLILLQMLVVGAALQKPMSSVAERGVHILDGRYAVVEPREWVGKPFPLLEFSSVPELSSGEWLILLVREGCKSCDTALRRFRDPAATLSVERSNTRHAILEERYTMLPENSASDHTSDDCVTGTLSSRYPWLIPWPTRVRLSDGIVTDVDVLEESLRFDTGSNRVHTT